MGTKKAAASMAGHREASSCPPMGTCEIGALACIAGVSEAKLLALLAGQRPARLAHLTAEEFAHFLSIPVIAGKRLAAAFRFRHQRLAAWGRHHPILSRPEVVGRILAPWADLDHERAWCLAVDARLHLLAAPREISRGGATGTELEPRDILIPAVRVGVSGLIVAHNHPGGARHASRSDRTATRHIVRAARTIGLILHDHVIIGPQGLCISMRREVPHVFA